MESKTPPLLEPYLGLPPETGLLVLSGVLGTSTNWLTLRCLASYLGEAGKDKDKDNDGAAPAPAVLLVSFMRDRAFWKDGAARLGLDLDALARRGRFGFVDGLAGLSAPAAVRAAVQAALPAAPVVLVLDQPDLLAAATAATAAAVRELVLALREQVYATVVTVAADAPLVAPQQTTLEREHAALVLALAHEADVVLAARPLDTGAARHVSGVLRITRGGSGGGGYGPAVEEHEYLYHVGADGSVRVFERGQ